MEATVIGLRTEILEKVLANEKLKRLVLGTQSDLKYSGLNQEQIAEVEYTRSIYERMRPQFDLILKRIENNKPMLQELEELLTKTCLLYKDVFRITVNGEKGDFVTYLRNFQIPALKKDEKLEIPFLLEHGLRLVLVGNLRVSEYEGEIHFSLIYDERTHNSFSNSSEDPLDFLFLTFSRCINEKYVWPLYLGYLKDNNLVDIRNKIFEQINMIDSFRHRLKLGEAWQTLNDVELSILKYIDFPYFFQEVSEKIASQANLLAELEKISNPNMDIIERMYLCKGYHLNNFWVIPGDGKRFVVAVHGINLWDNNEEWIVDYLTNTGFGGSIILFGDVRIDTFEHFLIKEKKLGAIIHNTGMWHESTLHEILEHSFTDEEDNSFCRSLPHNINGEHDSENNLTSEEFLSKIKNFI